MSDRAGRLAAERTTIGLPALPLRRTGTWLTGRARGLRRLARSGPAMIACAFVPPNPKELTPAKQVCLLTGSSIASPATQRLSVTNAMSGLGVLKCRDRGRRPCSRASIALSNPASPDAGSRWPMFDLTDPIGRGRERRCPSARPKASASAGSPARVPVPCASTKHRSSGSTPDLRYTSSSRRACLAADGSETPTVRPSELTPVPTRRQ